MVDGLVRVRVRVIARVGSGRMDGRGLFGGLACFALLALLALHVCMYVGNVYYHFYFL